MAWPSNDDNTLIHKIITTQGNNVTTKTKSKKLRLLYGTELKTIESLIAWMNNKRILPNEHIFKMQQGVYITR